MRTCGQLCSCDKLVHSALLSASLSYDPSWVDQKYFFFFFFKIPRPPPIPPLSPHPPLPRSRRGGGARPAPPPPPFSCQDESRSKRRCRRTCHCCCCCWTQASKPVSSRSQKPSRKGPRTRERACWNRATRAARCCSEGTAESRRAW